MAQGYCTAKQLKSMNILSLNACGITNY